MIDSAENLAKDIQRQKEILEEVQKKVSILINLVIDIQKHNFWHYYCHIKSILCFQFKKKDILDQACDIY